MLITLMWVQLFNNRLVTLPVINKIVNDTPAEMLPPLGVFLNPFTGFWQNAETEKPNIKSKVVLSQLKAPATVVFDERLVPHIFAENDEDLFFLQGYVTAYHRLWQMEFQTHAAAGRISEIVGGKGIDFDRKQRRKGMIFAAERAISHFEDDTLSNKIVQAYADGVNAYIEQLTPKKYPLEYKLLGYVPEKWTVLKSAFLLKYMADKLTGNERDMQLTNARKILGKKHFDLLFPDMADGQDPVIPVGTTWDFEPTQKPDSTGAKLGFENTDLIQHEIFGQSPLDIGSNNWALAGKKTASGYPILCNDPHLNLGLPAIWYEIQLHSPTVNVYGVSLPGSPNVIIGFNKDVSWGITNSGRDVKDWYATTFKDEKKKAYLYNNKWKKASKRIERIQVRDAQSVYDTVTYTHLGPIVYEDSLHQKNNMALRWQAHEPSNELLTFYYFNRAKNYDDYLKALKYYECPGQNFVFADNSGTIALWQQGKFPLLWEEQGKFVLDANNPTHEWQGYIPQAHNPHAVNPERGFVSSANQHAADKTYPYYYQGVVLEYYRNRRLNQQLMMMEQATKEEMKRLQTDNYNLQAAEAMPTLLSYVEEMELSEMEEKAYEMLKTWNFMNDAELEAPSIYEAFWVKVHRRLWDELEMPEGTPMVFPNRYVTTQLLITQPSHELIDFQETPEKETAKEIVQTAFKEAITEFYADVTKGKTWAAYRGSKIEHLARINSFSLENLKIGGYKGILNAMRGKDGPSWRMIVSLDKDKPTAFGIYPGGQSGNPGSPYYTNFVKTWTEGEYARLLFMTNVNEPVENVWARQNFVKE